MCVNTERLLMVVPQWVCGRLGGEGTTHEVRWQSPYGSNGF
jgi:hypothetical protein